MSMFPSAEVKKTSDTEVEISAEIPADIFESYRGAALKHLGGEIEIPGFRQGHIPESVLVGKVGDSVILQEMAETAVADAYPEILSAEKVRAIGRPVITLTKIARGNPLGFRARTAVLSEITLPDYKKVAADVRGKEGEPIFVSDEEVEKTIDGIRKNWAKHDTNTRMKSNDTNENEKEVKNETPPELTDEFAQKLGNFKTVGDLRLKIKENLKEEKTAREKEKQRVRLIDELLKETPFPVHDTLVDAEKERMLAQFKGNISQMGVRLDDYLKKVGKTEDEMKRDWGDEARKRVRIELILNEIAEKENIHPDEKEVKEATDGLVKRYADADPLRAKAYIEGMLTNEAVFAFLENPTRITMPDGRQANENEWHE